MATDLSYYTRVGKAGTMIYSISPTRKVRVRFKALRDYWVLIAGQCERRDLYNWHTVRQFRAEYSGVLLDDMTQTIAVWIAEHWDDAYHGEVPLWRALTGIDGEVFEMRTPEEGSDALQGG